MKANIVRAQEEDAVKVKERQARIKIMNDEIKKANVAAITLKDEAKVRDK